MQIREPNLHPETVEDFGREWKHFDQSGVDEAELREHFEKYFRIFPWSSLPRDAKGFDLGCGSGRWAKFVAPRVGALHCIDASETALNVARKTLAGFSGCHFHCASVEAMPIEDDSMDFGYSLGVLHHIPDPAAGLKACVAKLRPGAPFLIYLYYALDDRPSWFRALWRASDLLRRQISPLSHQLKVVATFPIALFVYLPLSRLAALMSFLGVDPKGIPLAYYRHASFYTLRTDALDRFGTRLEARFTLKDVHNLMETAGLERIEISDREPFWCAMGIRRSVD